MSVRLRSALLLAALSLAGCASVRPQDAFDDVRQTVAERAPATRVTWITGAPEDAEAEAAVAALLADSVTADEAVQVALLSNRHLQATYEDLGVAQAALVQAGLLANPVFGGRTQWPLDGGAPHLGASVAVGFLDVFKRPLRRRVARSEVEAAQIRVAEAVLDLAVRTRVAYVEVQAAEARLALQRRVVRNAEAAYEAARLLREAGNVPAVDLLAEQAAYERARLDLVAEEAGAIARREALVRQMGLFGERAAVPLAGTLPLVPAELGPTLDVAVLEREAVAASLALAAARQDVETAARRLGLTATEALLPDLDLGAEAERDDGEWALGPEAEVVLPLFDQGQARRAAARADLRRRQALYYATAVDVRSAARVLAARLAAAHQAALHAQRVVLPLHAELTQQTLLQYNAMQTGVFGLLQAQQLEAEAARRTVDAVAAYWAARADLDALRQGRMPALDGAPALASPSGPAPREAADH